MENDSKQTPASSSRASARLAPSRVRTIVFLAVLVLVAIGYFTSVGIGNMSAIGWDAWSLICPLGYLESLLAGKVFIPRALISFLLVVAATVVVGRVFCAWVCPMPFLQRWIPGIGRKGKGRKGMPAESEADVQDAGSADKAALAHDAAGCAAVQAQGRPNRFKFDSRYGVLLGALASAAIFGFPLFCLICPVGLTFATVLLVMRLFAFGEATWTVVAVPLVLVVEVVLARKWCHRFCPLGALVSLISGANKTLRPTIDDAKCINSAHGHACFMCSKVCPEMLDIRRPAASPRSLNNCTKCRECAAACPSQAISFPLLPAKQGDVAQEAPDNQEALA